MTPTEERFNPADFPSCLADPQRLKFRTWIEHIPFAMLLIEGLQPRLLVELGTFAGDSYCAFCQAVKALNVSARCFAVDTWQGDPQAGGYGPEFLTNLREHHDPRYGEFSTLLQMTFDEARPKFEPGSIDLLHIDGLHSYDAVRHDFENYLSAVSDRGIVLLHDVAVRKPGYGVWRLYEELAARYPHFQFSHNNGLAVLAVGKEIPHTLRGLFTAGPDEQQRIRRFFEVLGARCAARLDAQEADARTQEQVAHLERTGGHADRTRAHFERLHTEEVEAYKTLQTALASEKARQRDATGEIAQLALAKFQATGRRPQEYGITDLQPLSELVRREDIHTWESVGDDPHFLLPCYLPRGWMHVMMEMETAAPGPVGLYMDTGEGFTETGHIILGVPVDGRFVLNAHYPVNQPVRTLRIDPQMCPGTFKIKSFHVRHLSLPRFLLRAGRAMYRRRRSEGRFFLSVWNAMAMMVRHGPSRVVNRTVADAMIGRDAPAMGYQRWCRSRSLTPARRRELEQQAQQLGDGPLISVLMPVFNTPEKVLRAAIESVRRQVYARWELCIVDDRSTDGRVREVLAEYAAADPRIRVIHSDSNGGISAASNAALTSVTGEFVALLDHDDELAPQALLAMAAELRAHPETDILYSDEDKLMPSGERAFPSFKPTFAPEYLMACNYICHLGVYRTALLRDIGGFRQAYDGAQDYDLLLRASLKTSPARIRRIADVLYHWRISESSTAGGVEVKPQAHRASKKALEEYLRAAYPDFPAEIDDGPMPTWHRVRFAIKDEPMVSIIIPSKCDLAEVEAAEGSIAEKRYHLEHCVKSILEKSTYRNIEILSVDRNQMPADLAQRLAARGVKRITYDFDFNWSKVNNFAAAQAKGSHLLFLNDDMEVISPDWIEAMLEYSQLPDIGAVGAKLLWPDRRIQHAGVIIFNNLPSHAFYGCEENHADHCHSTMIPRNYSAVTGACLMTRADVFRMPEIGGFSEEFPLAYNDTDYCLKVWRAGKRVVYTPYAKLFHLESSTRSPDVKQFEIRLFTSRWRELAKGDPFYNPNLSTTYLDFRVAEV